MNMDTLEDELTEEFLSTLGFGQESYQTVGAGIVLVLQHWSTPDINPKYYSGFHKLEELTVEHFVDFYAHLEFELKRYRIVLMPFDDILTKWQHVGLSMPGIGGFRYLEMAEALFNLLERLLPMADETVKKCTTSLVGSSHDGFKLLHSIMAKSIPDFCPSLPSEIPL